MAFAGRNSEIPGCRCPKHDCEKSSTESDNRKFWVVPEIDHICDCLGNCRVDGCHHEHAQKVEYGSHKNGFFGAMDRVDTHVAIAFGASVQPFTKITPKVNTTMIKRIGFVWMLSIKSENVIVIDCTSTLSS